MRLYYDGQPLGGVNSANLEWGRTLLRSKTGFGYGYLHRASCSSVRCAVAGPEEADLTIASIEALLKGRERNLILKHDDGTNSAKSIIDTDSYSGVVCVEGPRWLATPGAQHVTFLDYAVAFEWKTYLGGVDDLITDFKETVTIQGGQPLWVVQEPINVGSSLRLQNTLPKQKYTAVQEGYKTKLKGGYPDPPDPIEGLGKLVDKIIVRVGADREGRSLENYTIRFRYTFVNNVEPVGLPNQWED